MARSRATNYRTAYQNVLNVNSPARLPASASHSNGLVIKHRTVPMVPMKWIAVSILSTCRRPTTSFASGSWLECQKDDFVCTNGQCIKGSSRCDGLPLCRDGSDEFNCNFTAPCTEFQCANKRCIPKAWLCDGTIDCSKDGSDRSDERNCNQTKCDIESGREFRCADMPSGKCFLVSQKCDGHDDCGDGSDEANCSCTCGHNLFACKELCQCIPVEQVCDGKAQCTDGTDERNCKCNKGEYTCNNGLCINATKLCDGKKDCPKGDDETHSSCSKKHAILILFRSIDAIHRQLSRADHNHVTDDPNNQSAHHETFEYVSPSM